MSTKREKPDLSKLLAETGGSARYRRAEPQVHSEEEPDTAATPQPKGRVGTSPITVHFPKQVRDQLKILAVEQNTTLHNLIAEGFNDLFAKYRKPEIAPADSSSQAA
jgi:hypothetical protein